jgi:hypothetical protein
MWNLLFDASIGTPSSGTSVDPTMWSWMMSASASFRPNARAAGAVHDVVKRRHRL